MVRIGIPRALFYYVYFPKWETFFRALGAEVIVSGETTKQILDFGVREAVADACVPVKVYFGHTLDLQDKVDYLFIPRIVCVNKKTVFCPKFLGLPDMIRHALPGVPPVIDIRIDTRTRRLAIWKAYQNTGHFLGYSKGQIFKAYKLANKVHNKYIKLLTSGYQPKEAMALIKGQKIHRNHNGKKEITIALLGYPYVIYDLYLSSQLIYKLERQNVRVLTTENLKQQTLNRQQTNLKKNFFWTFSENVMRAAKYYFQSGLIDGAIHLTAFGCGPDSILNYFIKREAKKHPLVPLMTLTMDEHSGEAGITTRLEAFIDMIKRKQRRDSRCPLE